MVELESDASAAGGGESEQSAWQRSADEEGALPPTKMPGTATGRRIGFFFLDLSSAVHKQRNMRMWWNW